MAKKFGFFNSINGDRKYLASDIAEAFGIGIATGLKSEEGNLEVFPYQNMQVKINPGGAMIFGHFYLNDEEEIIDIDIADGELNRIDRIVLRYDKYERSIKTVVIKGTPALNPVAPTRLETNEQFDLVLADIYVPKAATSITTSNITDMRESELCGYIGVKGAVTNLEFDAHLTEDMSQIISIAFDLSIISTGSVTYIGPFSRKPKHISIMARINDTKMASWGELNPQGSQSRMNYTGIGSFSGASSNFLALDNGSGSYVTATGKIESDNRIKLTWTKGTGETLNSQAIVYATAIFHGGD